MTHIYGLIHSLISYSSEVSEKRTIWLCEVAVLTVLGIGVLLLHHTPYVLALLTVLTLAYTQLLERVNFR